MCYSVHAVSQSIMAMLQLSSTMLPSICAHVVQHHYVCMIAVVQAAPQPAVGLVTAACSGPLATIGGCCS